MERLLKSALPFSPLAHSVLSLCCCYSLFAKFGLGTGLEGEQALSISKEK